MISHTILLSVHLNHPHDFIDARHRARQIALQLTFNIQDQTRIGTAVSEVAREMYQHTASGKVEFTIYHVDKMLRITVTQQTNNPEKAALIPSIQMIQASGIEAVKKIVERFSIAQTAEYGIVITMEMRLPHTAPSITPVFLDQFSKYLLKNRPKNASEEIYHQNKEILHTLKLLKQSKDELETRVEQRTAELSQEIAAKNLIERSLQETQERLELALTAAHVGTWSWNIKDNTIFWDNHMYPLFGLKVDKNVQVSWNDWLNYVYLTDQDTLRIAFESALQQALHLEVEFRVGHSKNALKYLTLRGQVYFDIQGAPEKIAGICWDITERKRYEAQLYSYQRQIAQSTRAHSIGEMASTISHELNQPLTAISAYAKGCLIRLEKGAIQPVELIHALKELSHQAERAGAILHRIKDFVRQGSIELETVSLEGVILNCIKLIRYELPNIETRILHEFEKNLPSLSVDKVKIEQVIINLLRNSMEALQEAKTYLPTITIKTKKDDRQNAVVVSISDNGPGFTSEVKKRLFEPYFTTKAEGMGIGLAICKTLIEAHQGTLNIKSTSQGACFEFVLPF